MHKLKCEIERYYSLLCKHELADAEVEELYESYRAVCCPTHCDLVGYRDRFQDAYDGAVQQERERWQSWVGGQ